MDRCTDETTTCMANRCNKWNILLESCTSVLLGFTRFQLHKRTPFICLLSLRIAATVTPSLVMRATTVFTARGGNPCARTKT